MRAETKALAIIVAIALCIGVARAGDGKSNGGISDSAYRMANALERIADQLEHRK